MGNCLSIFSDIITIIAGIFAIAAFFGISDKLSFVKRRKVNKIKTLIKTNKDAEFITFRPNPNAPWLDRDYLMIDSKLHWIQNEETLEYVCKYNTNATFDPDKKPKIIKQQELIKLPIGETLNIKLD